MKPTKSNQTKHFAAKEKGLREACFAHGGEAHVGAAIRSGMVRGPGGPREDKIPARLSNGEYVLPADVVKKIGRKNLDDMLEAHHNPRIDRDGDGDASMSMEGDATMQAMQGGLRFSDGGAMILPIEPITPMERGRTKPIMSRADGGMVLDSMADPNSRIVRPVIKSSPVQVPVLLADGGMATPNSRIVRPVIKDQSPLLSPLRSMENELQNPLHLAEGGPVLEDPNTALAAAGMTAGARGIIPGSGPGMPMSPTPNLPVPYQSKVPIPAPSPVPVRAMPPSPPALPPAAPPAAGGTPAAAPGGGGGFMRGAFSGPAAAAVATADSAMDSYGTPTDNYARRLGADRTPGPVATGVDTALRSAPFIGAAYDMMFPNREAAAGMLTDLPIRTAGVMSDAGANVLDMGTSAVNAGLRATGSNKQLTPFKTILQQQDEPGRPIATPYTTLPSRQTSAPASTPASVAPASTGAAPVAPRQPQPGEYGGGLKIVDQKDAEGNIIHRTITGEGAKGEGLRAPVEGASYSDRRLAPLTAPRVRYGAPSGSNFPGADPFQSGRMARGIQRHQDNAYASMNNQRDIAEMKARSDEGIQRANNESRERIERMQAESQAASRAAQSAREDVKMRQDSENHVTKQLESIFVKQDKDNKTIPDLDKIADFKRHIAPTIASDIKKLESIPPNNPAYRAAQARAAKLRSAGQVDVNDPQFAKYIAAYNLKQRLKDSSGMLYGKGTYRDSDDLNDFMNPTVRENAFGQKRYVFANGAELPVNDAAYQEGPANLILPDVFKTPTSVFKPALGIRQ